MLQWIAQGRRLTEIAEHLNLSIKTVSTYRSRLLIKLGMRTTAELIRYALDQQLVCPPEIRKEAHLHTHTRMQARPSCDADTPRQAGTSRFIIISCRGLWPNILIINADSNLKRLIKLALPGMEHFVQHSASWQPLHAPSSSKLDLVIARLVADDDQNRRTLLSLRKAFPTARLIVTAALHDPALEGQKVSARRARAAD